MNRNAVMRMSALAFGALVLFVLRDVFKVAFVVLMGGVILLLPYLIAMGILVFLLVMAYRFTHHQSGRPSVQSDTPQRNAGTATTGLVDQLTAHFARNHAQRLHETLTSLPAWPITTRIQATAQELLTLKQSIYRAQREGVPPTVIQRYLDN